MKVIYAGFPKTGTKSVLAALQELGYTVHDSIDHFWYHEKGWDKILLKGTGRIEDFKKMYANIDAVSDCPASIFWEEIHEAFPDTKIIMTTRDEDKYIKSILNQLKEVQTNIALQILFTFTPTGRRFYKNAQAQGSIIFGDPHIFSYFSKSEGNALDLKRRFRMHQAYCQQLDVKMTVGELMYLLVIRKPMVYENAPKDKLLVYNVSDGWEPLCRFLGKPVPNKPFPFENVGGKLFEKLLETHPAMLRMKNEFLVSLALLLGVVGFGGYKLYRSEVASVITKTISIRIGLA